MCLKRRRRSKSGGRGRRNADNSCKNRRNYYCNAKKNSRIGGFIIIFALMTFIIEIAAAVAGMFGDNKTIFIVITVKRENHT